MLILTFSEILLGRNVVDANKLKVMKFDKRSGILYAIILTIILLIFMRNKDDLISLDHQSPHISKIFNVTNFKFLIQHPPCPENGLDLLVLVVSAPQNFRQREVIRRTWANQEQNSKFGNFVVYFLLGIADTNIVQGQIALENEMFKDIIQGSFIDQYENLTYKTVMGLKWYDTFCSNTQILLKIDDDVIVNMPYILRATQNGFWQFIEDANKDFLFCREFVNQPVERNNGSRYYVSTDEFSDDVYPNFCMGSAIFFTSQTVKTLLAKMENVKYLYLEDVFMTGLVRNQTSIKVTSCDSLCNDNVEEITLLSRFENLEIQNIFIGPFGIDMVKEGDLLWRGLQNLNKHHKLV